MSAEKNPLKALNCNCNRGIEHSITFAILFYVFTAHPFDNNKASKDVPDALSEFPIKSIVPPTGEACIFVAQGTEFKYPIDVIKLLPNNNTVKEFGSAIVGLKVTIWL